MTSALNPVLYKDLLVSLSSRRGTALTCLFALAAMVGSIGFLSQWDPLALGNPGKTALHGVGGFILLVTSVIAYHRGLVGIASEYEKQTFPLVMGTPLSAWRFAFGKTAAAWLASVVPASVALPFLAAAPAMGGVGPSDVALTILAICTWSALAAAAGTAVSASTRTVASAWLSGVLLAWFAAYASWFAVLASTLREAYPREGAGPGAGIAHILLPQVSVALGRPGGTWDWLLHLAIITPITAHFLLVAAKRVAAETNSATEPFGAWESATLALAFCVMGGVLGSGAIPGLAATYGLWHALAFITTTRSYRFGKWWHGFVHLGMLASGCVAAILSVAGQRGLPFAAICVMTFALLFSVDFCLSVFSRRNGGAKNAGFVLLCALWLFVVPAMVQKMTGVELSYAEGLTSALNALRTTPQTDAGAILLQEGKTYYASAYAFTLAILAIAIGGMRLPFYLAKTREDIEKP